MVFKNNCLINLSFSGTLRKSVIHEQKNNIFNNSFTLSCWSYSVFATLRREDRTWSVEGRRLSRVVDIELAALISVATKFSSQHTTPRFPNELYSASSHCPEFHSANPSAAILQRYSSASNPTSRTGCTTNRSASADIVKASNIR